MEKHVQLYGGILDGLWTDLEHNFDEITLKFSLEDEKSQRKATYVKTLFKNRETKEKRVFWVEKNVSLPGIFLKDI